MATLNKVMLIGRLTRDPEPPRTLPNSGSRVIKFGFAVSRNRKNPQTGAWENDPNPLFIDCEAFSRPDAKRDLVNLIQQYCKQGDQLYIEGRLQLDQWVDKNTNQNRSKHKVVVDNLEFLGASKGHQEGGVPAGRPSSTSSPAPTPDEGGPPPEYYGNGGGEPAGDGDPIPF